ncbi:MAG: hypothetical protein QOK34_11 [Gaiellaceae bacterium]|jgi:hypothetical protein|nr:hypothetical protein [Gaiellaceae bacterium]
MTNWALAGVFVAAVAIAAKEGRKRVRLAVDAYMEEVSSGSKPIEGVGTAVATFIGFEPTR